MNDLSWFWIWWTLTVGLAGAQIIRASFSVRIAIGFPTVVGCMWLYFYGVLPYVLTSHHSGSVPADILALAQFQAFVSYAALLAGWHYRLSRKSRRRGWRAPVQIDLARLFKGGIVLLVVGLAGQLSFRASGRGLGESSAYWYLLFHLCYAGVSLCVVALTLSPARRRMETIAIVALLAAPIILGQLLAARRGPTFVAVIAITFSYLLVRPRPPRPTHILAIIGGSGALLLFLVSSRDVLYREGGTWSEVVDSSSMESVVDNRTESTGDNEFFNHCLLLEANLDSGCYQYGTTHLAGLLNWVPRRFWPGKPQRSTGFFPEAIRFVKSDQRHNLGIGGSWGTVADSFNNYWYFFPVYWVLIGYGVAAMFARGFIENSLRWKVHYVGVLCVTHWFVGQNFAEAIVPALIYQASYFVAFRFATGPRSAFKRSRMGEREFPRWA